MSINEWTEGFIKHIEADEFQWELTKGLNQKQKQSFYINFCQTIYKRLGLYESVQA